MIDGQNRPVFLIRIAADMLGIHPQTLRIWEHEGLITPARRSNQRLYSNADIEFIRRIRYLTDELGVNLAGVSLLLKLEEAGRFTFAELVALASGAPIVILQENESASAKPHAKED
jgi:MerR family transcriptional regulator/heat shock protein HspR